MEAWCPSCTGTVNPLDHETEKTINAWQHALFGDAGSPLRTAARANEEMAELLKELSKSVIDEDKVAEEGADVVIVLLDIFRKLKRNMWEEVTKKMKINRARKWGPVVDGHTYHVREE